MESHPIKLYLNLGGRVTVNTDNRLITDTTVSKELWLLHRHLGFTLTDIKQVIINGFKSSFQPFHERRQLLARISDELAAFTDPDEHPLQERLNLTAPPPGDADAG